MKQFINKYLNLFLVAIFVLSPFIHHNQAAAQNSVFSDSHLQNYKQSLSAQPKAPRVYTKPKQNTVTKSTAPAVKNKVQATAKPVATPTKIQKSNTSIDKTKTETVKIDTTKATDNQNFASESSELNDNPVDNLAKLDISLEEFVKDTAKTDSEFPIRNLQDFNIYSVLPKISQRLILIDPELESITYGPFKISSDMYKWPYSSTENLTQRIVALKSTLEKLDADANTNTEDRTKDRIKKNTLSLNIHLGDLYSMKYSKTGVTKYLDEANKIYKSIYDDVPETMMEAFGHNMANSLIRNGDVTTAFPLIKNLAKNESSKHTDEIRNTIFEFYYLSGRHQKADDIVNILIDNDELKNQSDSFRIRAGDIMFMLNRFQDASEWYQSVLKPEKTIAKSEKLSWLYLAEALHQLGNEEVSQKIYRSMKDIFADSIYGHVIDFRLAKNIKEKELAIKATSDIKLTEWLKIDFLTEQFFANPNLFASDQFIPLLSSINLDPSTKNQLELLYGYALFRENRFYDAIEKFHTMEIKNKNRFVRHALNELVIRSLMKQGLATKSSDDASDYIRFMMSMKYNLKSYSPDKIYQVIYHNLDLIGLENASAELTLKIIDQSVHDKKGKLYIQFKLAENMADAFAHRQSIKILSQIDTKLLDPKTREKYNVLMIDNMLETNQNVLALDILDNWSKQGTTPKQSYWIALKKMEILFEFKRYEEALDVADTTMGSQAIDKLPVELHELVTPVVAYKVILANKLGRNNECLVTFYQNQDKILTSALKDDILVAAISSAMTMNKTKDIKQLMQIAETKLDQRTYEWMQKWTSGEMWINQVNKYLDNSNIAINEEGKQP